MNIQELKLKSSEQLITQAKLENASTLRKHLFAILKKVAEKEKLQVLVCCNYCKMVRFFKSNGS